MEDAEETSLESQSPKQSTSDTSRNSTDIDELLAPPESKRQRKDFLTVESEKILHDCLTDDQFEPYPSDVEKQMRSGQTNLSFLQITNWFVNADKYFLPEVLEQDKDGSGYLKDKDADEIQLPDTTSSSLVQSGPVDPEKVQCFPLSQSTKSQEPPKKLQVVEKSSSQQLILEAPLKEKVEMSICDTTTFPESVGPEAYADFSNFYLLVDVALQKAAELELQKKQEANT
ncbi:homeobox protein TGIF2LX-like [Octodon degus]|uniref:Homeobox protein TGIF2LX-like n=1 Tax=Octodon degus TaxID=10160 RepID=A0A6P3F4W6_OCTDE|nr:homeobox protein TGIF2LX-like [Octodon degus]